MIQALRFSLLLASGTILLGQSYTISTLAGGAPIATPVAATNASMGPPQRVALDGGGNLYFSSANSVFKVDGSGSLTVVAGNSRAGYSGDGDAATQAQLNQPQGIAVAKDGTLYIADTGNHVVRVVTPDGNINTFAGNGSAGYTGDAGLAIYAQLDRPVGVAVDSSGNVYVADSGSFVVRKVTTDGNIATVAGNGLPGFAGDGGAFLGAGGPSDCETSSMSKMRSALAGMTGGRPASP